MLKRLFTGLILLGASVAGFAQQKIIERAIIKSKTEITFPQNINRNAGGDDEGNAGFGGPGGMESKSTVYFRGDLVKTYNESDFGNTTVIIDKRNKRTTTLREAMGRKTGFYSTEEDEAAMRKNMEARRDSIRRARGQSVNSAAASTTEAEIVATDETKKIAGYNCKKAIIKTKSRQGEINETIVWYTPGFKMAPGYPAAGNTGGSFGRGMRGQRGGFGITGLDKIDGFIMGYDVSRSNGFEMHMEVTKVELDAALDDKVFAVPKGYDIKPLSEMQDQFRAVRITRNEENN